MRSRWILALWLPSACGVPTADAAPSPAGPSPETAVVHAGPEPAALPSEHLAAFVGDPIDREREILEVTDAEDPDDFLLDLPGSAGLNVNAAADLVREGGHSVGTPQRGRLHDGVMLPLNPALYTRRRPERSYGSTQTIRTIQTALSTLRKDKGVWSEVIISDISLPTGGPIAPHVSHQSGRDIDIRLVLAAGLDRTTVPVEAHQVDWDATWSLVHSFLETGEVTHVFLDYARQAMLHDAALRAGVHPKVADRWFQWPQPGAVAMIAHEDGHRAHVHIRLACAYEEPGCTSP